jgi:hypothetical protein
LKITEKINQFLEWLKVKPIKKEQEEAWPFAIEFTPAPKKRKPRVAKATTRPAAKKIVKPATKIVKKKAK